MQSRFGYAPDEPQQANYAVCSNQIAQRYDCLSVTLEMPFKDAANNLDGSSTFQGARAAALGGSLLNALAHVSANLRGVPEPIFGAEDAYVTPIEDAAAVESYVLERLAAVGRA